MTLMVQTPNVSWAQREDSIWLTVELEHPENLKVDLEGRLLRLSAVQDGTSFQVELPLFAEIDLEKSRYNQHRFIDFFLRKVESVSWPRLTEQSLKRPWLKVDWTRWVDSDDEGELQDGAGNSFDVSGMQNFADLARFQNTGDSDDEDEELEDLPDLKDNLDSEIDAELKTAA